MGPEVDADVREARASTQWWRATSSIPCLPVLRMLLTLEKRYYTSRCTPVLRRGVEPCFIADTYEVPLVLAERR